ncbi:MAG: hypothetical protein BWZ01_00183 [Deltaproteobacteria bacterium ADurb.BinA179]|jgi:hypothetical protein|nr:MAG: hypothetical protein BWZ01_00183 [Deltaproteobacteria bacterium ADurb.BinA179]
MGNIEHGLGLPEETRSHIARAMEACGNTQA